MKKFHYTKSLIGKSAGRILGLSIVTLMLLSSCQKPILSKEDEIQAVKVQAKLNENSSFMAADMPFRTAWELQQAKAATAKYQNIKNALADGYADISADVEHMGHHYLNSQLLDGTFDVRHPEILVYNKDENGQQQLVAVEYAIPLNEPMPQGFTGDADVWDPNAGFGLWLLHAWVWRQNPDGVFKPFNPTVELH